MNTMQEKFIQDNPFGLPCHCEDFDGHGPDCLFGMYLKLMELPEENKQLRAQLAASETALAESRLETITAIEEAQEATGKLQAMTAALGDAWLKVATIGMGLDGPLDHHSVGLARKRILELYDEIQAAIDAARGDGYG
jgi:hypothetical protein